MYDTRQRPQGGPQFAGRVYDHATVCCCLPLRTAVALTGVGCVLLALALLCARDATEETLRPFVGGYGAQSRALVHILELLGLIWGIVGFVGAVLLKTSYVKLYLGYQVARLLAWLLVFYTDVPLLWNCELWVQDLKRATQRYGWNDTIFAVALGNRCADERTSFAMFSIPALLFYLYCTAATQQLLAELEEEPRYLLKAPKGAPSGAFYTRSLASRSLRAQAEEEAKEEARKKDLEGKADALFDALDRNRDGVISREELAAMPQVLQGACAGNVLFPSAPPPPFGSLPAGSGLPGPVSQRQGAGVWVHEAL